MPSSKTATDEPWGDPDDATEWAADVYDRAALTRGDVVVREASGTLTRRGRPRSASPKRQVTLRLDGEVVEHFRSTGPGWQSRINDALLKAVRA